MKNNEMRTAVATRDAEFDGVFVYAVKTTGIYCRPSCPSRHAKPENMVFLEDASAAVSAGYRACLKCSPELIAPQSAVNELVREICKFLETAMTDYDGVKPTLGQLSKKTGYSEDYLSRSFKKQMGLGPMEYFDALRNRTLKQNLKNGESVAEAAFGAGFGSSSRLYEGAKQRLGMSPASYAKGGKGAQIAYVIVDCFLGRMLAAGTEQGVCAVYFADDDKTLIDDLNEEFPKAEIGQEVGELSYWTQKITDFLEHGGKVTPDIPLDMYGTAFQRLVWQELLKIAPGETKTYKQVATQIGREKSSRAVGRACATNPVSLIVPCHRVLGSDGKLHGYRWGLDRKAALMAWEGGA
ncbi:MAG: methylated-DNA--[protein]-cysteine S-methyltransferase [Sneathiella sp.]